MNLFELRVTVHRRSGVDYSVAALTDLVNEGLDAFTTEADWPWLERYSYLSTVAGQGTYPMPADWQRTRSITLDGDEVPFLSIRDLDSDPERAGYSTSGDSFTLSPIPESVRTVRMRYLASETVLVDDADVPKLPTQYHGAVIAWCVAEVHRRKGNYRAAENYEAAYQGWVKRIKKGMTRSTGPRRVRVRAGGAFGQ